MEEGEKLSEHFTYDPRLKIMIPTLDKPWTTYSMQTQNLIVTEWEKIRGHIPDRMIEVEKEITRKQELLNHEEDFDTSCELNREIAELASIINDLWIWFRATQHVSPVKTHN